MATLTGAVQLALLERYTPVMGESVTHTTSSGVTIYTVDDSRVENPGPSAVHPDGLLTGGVYKYEFIDDFTGAEYLVIADGASRVFLNDDIGASIIVGDDSVYIAAQDAGGNNKIIAGGGNNVIMLLDGNDAVRVGNGNNVIEAGAGNDTITAGNGNNTIIGGDGNDIVRVGNGNNVIDAGAGNDFVTVGKGSNLITTGAGDDVVRVAGDGSGTNYIDAGKGNDKITLATGTGVDTIVKGSVSGEIDTVTGFDTAHDKIAQAASTVSSTVISGNDTVVTFSDGSQVVLVGVQIADSSSFLV